MDYLVRFSQTHEDFRLAELQALADLHRLELKVVEYDQDSPFCIVSLPTPEAARKLVARSILAWGIYELWGQGGDYERLHDALKSSTASLWPLYRSCSFRFVFDSFRGSKSSAEQVALVESFRYMAFEGRIRMRNPDEVFCVFEEYGHRAPVPRRVLLGRLLGEGARDDVAKYDLKKRKYIATTSMDAELALVGGNIALARPGSLFYDPFMGTASLTIACSRHGATTLGSDLDGRTIRGKRSNNVATSYAQYGLRGRYLDGFVSDLTNTPLRLGSFAEHRPLFDGIVADPPYGVREGLKVLGRADGDREMKTAPDGRPSHLADDYIPSKRPYGFEAMLADLLEFAALTLVIDGRLSFWMPTANEEEVEIDIPAHPALHLVSACVQPFSKWSRRLLTYRRRRPDEITEPIAPREARHDVGKSADELNSFRKRYFEGFRNGE